MTHIHASMLHRNFFEFKKLWPKFLYIVFDQIYSKMAIKWFSIFWYIYTCILMYIKCCKCLYSYNFLHEDELWLNSAVVVPNKRDGVMDSVIDIQLLSVAVVEWPKNNIVLTMHMHRCTNTIHILRLEGVEFLWHFCCLIFHF